MTSPSDKVTSTPDELLLELMDLVALAFPEPLATMTVTFVPNEDGRRPALTNLAGNARPNQPKRPDLGHGDNAVLDAVNSLLADFADATQRQGGVRVLEGRIEVKTGDDGDRVVELYDKDALAMTRRFDRSELRWLFWTPHLFTRLHDTEAREREQRAFLDAVLRKYRRFDIDMQKGTIAFTGPEHAPRAWRFQLLGSWLDETKNFMWGWANEAVSPSSVKKTDAVRLGATDEGLRALTEPTFGCPEVCAERLARHAAVVMGAEGVYRAPFSSTQGKGVMYLALWGD